MSIHSLYPLILGHVGLDPIWRPFRKRQGTRWTGCKSIKGLTYRDRQTISHTYSLQFPVHQPCTSLDFGEKNRAPGGNQCLRSESMQMPRSRILTIWARVLPGHHATPTQDSPLSNMLMINMNGGGLGDGNHSNQWIIASRSKAQITK